MHPSSIHTRVIEFMETQCVCTYHTYIDINPSTCQDNICSVP